MTDNVNDKDLTPWLLNTILVTGDLMIKRDTSTERQ